MANKRIIICAGGTGGHLFPAVAVLKQFLKKQKNAVLFCDQRSFSYLEKTNEHVPCLQLDILKPAPSLLGKLKFAVSMLKAIYFCLWDFLKDRPQCVIGFGGYPSMPPMVASIVLFIPNFIFQQDAVMGRTNRLLSHFVSGIALAYGQVYEMSSMLIKKSFVTGPILREEFANIRYKEPDKLNLKILVTGGSQGAASLSTAIPKALQLLPQDLQQRLSILHQVRPENLELTLSEYQLTKVQFEVLTFIGNMADQMSKADLVIARSGIGTVSEIAASSKASILIPYPQAADNHQLYNAKLLEEKGAAIVIEESKFSLIEFAHLLERLFIDPENLLLMGQRAAKILKKGGSAAFCEEILRKVQ